MKEYLDNLISVAILLLFIFIAYQVGVEATEAKYCRINNGHYSFDYGECLK